MKNKKHFQKTFSQLGTTLLLVVTLTACAGQEEMDWASAQDPQNDGQEIDDVAGGDEGVLQTPPTSTPKPPTTNPAPPVTAPDSKTIFSTDGKLYTLAHNKATKWNGCASSALARGGYLSDTACGNAYLYQAFVGHLNKNFFTCVERAAQKANYAQPTRLFINHMGSYNDRTARGSTRLSNHAYARALDIKNFNLIDSRGNVTRVSTHVNNFKGATATFYDGFRQCWKDTMPSKCKAGQTEYQGSIGHPKSTVSGSNTLHNDHIHLSYPACAGA